jgi:hypothetical protein
LAKFRQKSAWNHMFQELSPFFDDAFARLTTQPTVDVIDELARTLAQALTTGRHADRC